MRGLGGGGGEEERKLPILPASVFYLPHWNLGVGGGGREMKRG